MSSLDQITCTHLKTLIYIPEFISEEEERALITDITASKAKWNVVSGRRVQNWGGIVGKSGFLIPAPIPHWLQRIVDRVTRELSIVCGDELATPNHVLINEYNPGDGILPHTDGPAYSPFACILSLGSTCVMNFTPSPPRLEDDTIDDSQAVSVFLMPRSLLIFKDDLYQKYMHGIEQKIVDDIGSPLPVNLEQCKGALNNDGAVLIERTSTRYSLTIRNVPRISGLRIG